jgi:protein-disulfide isomerase
MFLAVSAAAALLLGSTVGSAQDSVDVTELHAPGQLGEKVLGPSDAPVTVVEYASMSCPHCAQFHTTTFEPFRLKYVDTGKVRFIFREFPLNAPAYAVAMVARCAPADRYFDVVGKYFATQPTWMSAEDIRLGIFEVAKEFGFTEQSFEACLSNQALFKALDDVKARGASFGVQATPSFFINGKKQSSGLTMAELEKQIDPLLAPVTQDDPSGAEQAGGAAPGPAAEPQQPATGDQPAAPAPAPTQ